MNQKIDELNENLNISEVQRMRKKRQFEKLTENVTRIKNENENLKHELKNSITLLQDLNLNQKLVETENYRLCEKLGVAIIKKQRTEKGNRSFEETNY